MRLEPGCQSRLLVIVVLSEPPFPELTNSFYRGLSGRVEERVHGLVVSFGASASAVDCREKLRHVKRLVLSPDHTPRGAAVVARIPCGFTATSCSPVPTHGDSAERRLVPTAWFAPRWGASAHRAAPPRAGSEMKGWAGGSNQTGVGPPLPLEPHPPEGSRSYRHVERSCRASALLDPPDSADLKVCSYGSSAMAGWC